MHPFSQTDIEALVSAGSSTKRGDSNKTGYKGIGFKSVFGRSNRVSVFSGAYQFRFDKAYHGKRVPWQTIPIWTELTDIPQDAQESISRNRYKVSTIIELVNPDALISELNSLLGDGQILLFLRSITSITVSKNGHTQHKVIKEVMKTTAAFDEVKLTTNNNQHNWWLVKLFDRITIPQATKQLLEEDEDTPEKLKEAVETQISFAARLHEGNLNSLPKAESLVYTYLPTKVTDYAFPFLVNGSFLTNAPRENLHEDSVWNEWLFTQIADRLSDWLMLLATEQTYTYQVLQLLPEKFNSNQPLKRAFDKTFAGCIQTKAFIPVQNAQRKTPAEVIFDKTGLSRTSFVNPDSITEFIQNKTGKRFANDCFVDMQLQAANKLRMLQVETFELDNFGDFFASPAFTRRHDVSKNFQLIHYCKEQSDKDSKGMWFQTLKNLPFIYDESGKLSNSSNGICFPTGLSSTELGKVPLIHTEVFEEIEKNKPVFDWLRTLGVKEPSKIAYVTNVLIPGIRAGNFIDNDNYLRITRHLFRLQRNGELDTEMLECLRELPLKTKVGTFIAAQRCFLADKYQPQLKIETSALRANIVCEDYISSGTDELEWNLFFRAIKVKDRVEVEIINGNNNLSTLRRLLGADWVNICKIHAEAQGGYGYGEHNVIMQTRVPTFHDAIGNDIEYCRMFWKNVISSTAIFSDLMPMASYRYGRGYGENGFSKSVENYFPWLVKNVPCIPTTTGEIKLASDVFTNQKDIRQIAGDYLPVFDVEINLSTDWQGFLSLKPRLELEDLLEILHKISAEKTSDGKIKSGNIQRIGAIYNKLSELISNMATPDQEKIKTWAAENKLLSFRDTFEPAEDLQWVQIEEFDATATDNLNVIRIPGNVQKSAEGFTALMTLLGVKIIDKFIPDFSEKISDSALKERLADILPYYSVIYEYKKYERAADLFERLYNLLNGIEFYSAGKINLSFEHLDGLVAGPELRVYVDAKSVNYKGRWQSPLNMFDLVPALTELMQVYGLNDELRLLLESEQVDIDEFMQSRNYDLSKLPVKRTFRRSHQQAGTLALTTPISQTPTPAPSSPVATPSKPFIPDLAPTSIDMSKVKFTNISYEASSQSTPTASTETFAEMDSAEDRVNVGRWSEEFVNTYLKSNTNVFSDIVWANEDGESWKPYDFMVKENGVERYIDVKGTPSSDKNIVVLSGPEWLFMQEKAERYSIIRLYEAGKQTARINKIDNPAEKISTGLIMPSELRLQL